MKQTNYSYKKAPTLRATRWQAVAAFVYSATSTDEETAGLLRDWMNGLDVADTPEGDKFRESVAAASEVVITRDDPPKPAPPPPTVSTSMPLDAARLAVATWRVQAKADPRGAKALTATADALDAAIAGATAVAPDSPGALVIAADLP